MSGNHTILAPLPQLAMKDSIASKTPNPLLDEGLLFSPMAPELYRSFVNIAKEEGCSDEIVSLLQESGVVFWTEVPHPMPDAKRPALSALMYSSIADVILQRLFDCLLLMGYVPKPFRRFLWFFANGKPGEIDRKSLKLLEPEWNYNDFEIKYSEPTPADMIILGLQMYFKKLSPVLRVEQLKATFTDENKQKEYLAAGNKNVLIKTEELLKLRYGPNAHFAEDDQQDKMNSGPAESKRLPPLNSPKLSAKWCLEGYQRAFSNEIDKLDLTLYKDASGQRFIRAFQFFTNSCRLENPHRFVALATSLETLFCTTPREITFQLASRTAWFLNPNNFDKRKKLFTDIKNLYDVRSKIVHGSKFIISKIENDVEELESIAKEVFIKILSEEKLFDIFLNRNQNVCVQYLDDLNLG